LGRNAASKSGWPRRAGVVGSGWGDTDCGRAGWGRVDRGGEAARRAYRAVCPSSGRRLHLHRPPLPPPPHVPAAALTFRPSASGCAPLPPPAALPPAAPASAAATPAERPRRLVALCPTCRLLNRFARRLTAIIDPAPRTTSFTFARNSLTSSNWAAACCRLRHRFPFFPAGSNSDPLSFERTLDSLLANLVCVSFCRLHSIVLNSAQVPTVLLESLGLQ
jgi:hypothetical protein